MSEVGTAMMNPMSSDPDLLSEEARVIAEYLASDRYARRFRARRDYGSPPLCASSPFSAGAGSLWAGLVGLAVITAFLSFVVQAGVSAVNEFEFVTTSHRGMMFVFPLLIFPLIVGFSFAIVIPMFWYGSIVLRFFWATAVVLPGCWAFLVPIQPDEQGPPGEFVPVMLACFLSMATVSAVVQMWSPWSLSHARNDAHTLPRLGTRSIIELTTIYAVGCAVILTQDTSDVTEAMVIIPGIGVLVAGAAVFFLIAFLREAPRYRIATIIALVASFTVAFLASYMIAIAEYDWEVPLSEYFVIAVSAAFGAAVIYATMSLCLRWLHLCGWRCVRRQRDTSGQVSVD